MFLAIRAELGVKLLATTEYHPQLNEQMERYNDTMNIRRKHYTAEHHCDSNNDVVLLSYAYNM